MAGREETAITAASKVAARTNRDLLLAPGMGALQHYLVTPLFAQVRFQRWTEVLKAPAFEPALVYANAIRSYARALAFSARNDLGAAERELAQLRQASTSPALEGMTIWGINSWSSVLGVAVQAAAGDIALKRGETDKAIAIFEQGVALEDELTYDEPPTWHLSVRLQLGEALRKAGREGDAHRVYAEDQKRHPNNVWSR
jgi:tetratricopeptide (TPR) repeat protein